MSQENVEIVRRLYTAFNQLDTESFRNVWADDAEWRPALIGGGLLEGEVYRGLDDVAEFLKVQEETWESVTADPLAIRDLGENVLAEVRLRAVGRGSGVPVERITWTVFEIREDKIVAGRVYTVREEALEAVGLRE